MNKKLVVLFSGILCTWCFAEKTIVSNDNVIYFIEYINENKKNQNNRSSYILKVEDNLPEIPEDEIKPIDYTVIWTNGMGEKNILQKEIKNSQTLGIYPLLAATKNGTGIFQEKNTVIGDKNSVGLGGLAFNGGIIKNKGELYLENENSSGMVAFSNSNLKSQVINEGEISSNIKSGNFGMLSYGKEAIAVNQNIINLSKNFGMIALNLGKVENNLQGKIVTSNYGIVAHNKGSGINKGDIEVKGSYGMYASGKGSIVSNFGKVRTGGRYGIYATNGAHAINESNGMIISNQANGMGANGIGSIAENYGKIDVISHGMQSDNEGAAVNYGKIEVRSNGMTAIGPKSSVINENSGVINVSDVSGIAVENGGIGVNKGTININGDWGEGMVAYNGGRIENFGTINLNGSNLTGMAADGIGSTLINKGVINNVGINGNQEIKLSGGATFINSGAINSQEFNTANYGDGRFVLAKDGKINSNSIEGNIYISNDIVSDYNDIGRTSAFETNKITAEIQSDSAMFIAKLEKNTSETEYDVVMNRRQFNEIIKNEDQAALLEKTYFNSNNQEKDLFYSQLKKQRTDRDIEKITNRAIGNEFYPSIVKQNLDILRFNQNLLENNVYSKISNRNNNELKYIGGYSYGSLKTEESDFQNSYNSTLESIYLGVGKKFNNVDIGIVSGIGETTIKYDDSSRRDDHFYQLSLYGIYNTKNDIKFLLSPYFAINKGDIERNILLGDIKETGKAKSKNSYMGVEIGLSKKYLVQNTTEIIPKIKVNLVRMYQDSIEEKNTNYGVKLESKNTDIIETELGFALNHKLYLKNDMKVGITFSPAYNINIYQSSKDNIAKINFLDNEKIKLSKNTISNYGDLEFGIEVLKNNMKIYSKYNYIIDNKNNENKITFGFNYSFTN